MTAVRLAPDAQEAIARARFIRMSPTKARRVLDLIRGRHVDDARRVLRFAQQSAAQPIGKVLESAIANAEHNRELPSDELVVARAWVDEGPTLRRFRPRALGRATRIRKRTCHIAIVVGRSEEIMAQLAELREAEKSRKTSKRRAGEEEAGTGGRKKTAKKSTAKKTTAKKTTAKKTTAKKTSAKKTAAKKTAKKSTSKKTTRKRSSGED
ncbi:MAG: 50S ribosomal protein L22 [Actinomycetota bacterium]|nr:50S ribosomal protein L22 [Actinomycetota bacterium]